MTTVNTQESLVKASSLEEIANATKPVVKQDTIQIRGEKRIVWNVVKFDAVAVKRMQRVSEAIKNSSDTTGFISPLLSHFIGTDVVELRVDNNRSEFVIQRTDVTTSVDTFKAGGFTVNLPKEETVESASTSSFTIAFGTKEGKQLITFLTFVMPHFHPDFKKTVEFDSLQKLGLKSRLNARAAVAEQKARVGILAAAITMPDVYVVKDDLVYGRLTDMEEDELLDIVMKKAEGDVPKASVRPGIEFVSPKDVELENFNSPNTLWQKQTMSLNMERLATAKKKKPETILVKKNVQQDGLAYTMDEPMKAIVMEEIISLDANHLPFGDYNGSVAKAVFTKINIIHRANGELKEGEDLSESSFMTFRSFMKSTSQARSSGAVAFRSYNDVVAYFLGTGQDELAYSKTDKDKDGVPTGFNVMSVSAAYKRFMLAMSNGKAAEKGLLSTFSTGHRVKYFPAGKRNVIGLIKPAYIEITNAKGEVITIALINDFEAQISSEHGFLVNKLDKTNAFIGVEEFNHWENEKAIKALLTRNLTDGSGWVSSRITTAAREAGILNSHDAFQLRLSNAVKGAVHEFDEMCELFGADIVLTDGMVKAQDIFSDIKKNGFQMYVVGQRKDGADGAWLASQATQQLQMTEAEMIESINETVKFTQDAIDSQFTDNLLALLNATEEITDGEFVAVDYLRLAEQYGDVLDEQYVKDEIVSHAVKKLNKLLDSKLFVERARNRYMFTDPLALYNAAKDGRYNVTKEDAVLGAYEVVAASKKNGKFFMEMGEAVSNRFPLTVTHEASLVTAVAPPSYEKYIAAGLWQGCTFFDAVSWVVAEQAGADHDGDASTLVFDKAMVRARKRMNASLFAGNKVLPLIDAYVKYEDGVAIDFAMGCPEYTEGAEKVESVVEKMETINGFPVQGTNVYWKPYQFQGTDGQKRREDFLEVVAQISHEITVNTIETSLIGVIANRAMILTDLLTRTDNGRLVLSPEQLVSVQEDLIHLCVAGRWEIDRPKHGGAYMKMPKMIELFDKFKSIALSEDQVAMNDAGKQRFLEQTKGHYAHIFAKTVREGKVVGFRVVKPHWLASQKDEYGKARDGSVLENVLKHSNKVLVDMCAKYKVAHSKSASNQIRTRVLANIEIQRSEALALKMAVEEVYEAYKAKEEPRRAAEKDFKAKAAEKLKEEGEFIKKNMDSVTSAKKNAKIRKHHKEQLFEFSTARDLFKAQLRNDMYQLAIKLGKDVRVLVGVLYLVCNSMTGTGTASHVMDGREYRFVPSNGYISLPFEVFVEEMTAVISGKVSETFFVPLNTTFSMVKSSPTLQGEAAPTAPSNNLLANVFVPRPDKANQTVKPNRMVRTAVRPEETKSGVCMVMYFLNASCTKENIDEITVEDAAFAAKAPEGFFAGISSVHVNEITFNDTGKAARITFA